LTFESLLSIFWEVSDFDLNNLLEGWPHEPGQIKARKIVGNDGRDKVQLRIDLGLIQMEMNGRPDGEQPHGFESLLQYHQARAKAAKDGGNTYTLNEQDLLGLQHEGVQYYHRYISLFQLNDFRNVARDTKRNLELFDFVSEHATEDEAKWAFEQFRPYVIMMNTRARASLALEEKAAGTAVDVIQKGKAEIEVFYRSIGQPEWIETSSELAFLNEWLSEVRQNVPLSPLEAMERDLRKAIADEAYERAAELRDAIRKLSPKRPDEPVDL
jgi:UvrB/uvrC motif